MKYETGMKVVRRITFNGEEHIQVNHGTGKYETVEIMNDYTKSYNRIFELAKELNYSVFTPTGGYYTVLK